MTPSDLLQKYNIPVPRYTSYPTVPIWQEGINVAEWKNVFQHDFEEGNSTRGISLYIHLPFCESLCTYCGCNKRITTNHKVEGEYIDAVLKEWTIYQSLMSERPVIRELHLGGGTPTFFSAESLARLLMGILNSATIHPEHEFSFEGHPNNTTELQMQVLYDLGFRRVSFGVQDNDPEVQRIINRIQPFENVQKATETARRIGYKSVNFDLIYGLPLQTKESIQRTIEQTISLRPDRVAFYSYAHVPWTSRGQRLFDENDLPSTNNKIELYRTGKEMFVACGYKDIGMDHFAMPEDDLNTASEKGTLHRNFMGYTTLNSSMLLGLGVSSISSTDHAFAQNDKTLNGYYDSINNGELPIQKGYFMSEEDKRFGRYILDISCRGTTAFLSEDMETISQYCLPELQKLIPDNLITINNNIVTVTDLGWSFIRNICSCFDLYLIKSKVNKEQKMFSNAI